MLDFWKNKRILVTGHTGFKGSWLTEALLKLKDRMRSVTGDVRDLGRLLEVFRETQPEFVLHMAAQPIVRLSYREPVMTYETNVMGTVNICECVRQSPGVRSFLNVTTDKVYENGEKGTGFVETDRLDGYDPYSNSKSCSELVTHGYVRCCQHGESGKCDRRRRFRAGPHRPRLCQGCGERQPAGAPESGFRAAVPACAGAGHGLSGHSGEAGGGSLSRRSL